MNGWGLLALPAFPALSALILALYGRRLSYNGVGGLATAGAGLAFLAALACIPAGLAGTGAFLLLDAGPWLAAGEFHAPLRLRMDSLGLAMVLLVTFFGFLITAYSVGYMRHDRGQARFFAGLNLFVASMLLLVLADNLILIFLGWEGVGLCSYLLIGHYWEEKGVPLAAYRAFFVNRIGDLLFLLGVFTTWFAYGTLSLSELAQGAAADGGGAALLAALLLLGGAFAKSAQAPLHVWLADAMAGPTPVSALIHAATMVTAGIYLVARMDWLYAALPEVRVVIGACAMVTLVVGVFMALTQTDIKKILAYSTLANLALMFLALSAGAPQAALLHLFGHAFFKALLFLAAGSVILAAHHEQDVRRLGGVLKTMPVTRAAFWVGAIGGAGLAPFLSAGFFTKEAVLESIRVGTWDGFGLGVSGSVLFWIVLAVESLSAVYLFRLLGFLSGGREARAAHGGEETAAVPHTAHPPSGHGHDDIPRETSPLVRGVLAILAVAAPAFAVFSGTPLLLGWVTGGAGRHEPVDWAHVLPFMAINTVLAAAAFLVFASPRRREALAGALSRFRLGDRGPLARKFYFDDLYDAVIVLPLKVISWSLRLVVENVFIGALFVAGAVGNGASLLGRRLQTGRVHHYAALIFLFLAAAAGLLLWRRNG